MEDYVKTGEDKNFEYYRNDSEVLSGDGEEDPYEEIIYNKKDDFIVKVAGNEIRIKKETLYKLMILSKCQPEEYILFSLYKTVKNAGSQDKIKTQQIFNDNIRPNNINDLNTLRGKKAISFPHNVAPENENNNNENNGEELKIEEKENNEPNINENIPTDEKNEKEKKTESININDPLSSQMFVTGNNNNNDSNEQNQNVNVINIPSNEGSDNEEITFKKNINIENVLVGLPPQAVRVKWFYLLLCLVGIGYIVLFIIGLINVNVGFVFNTFCLCLIGIFLILTGLFGFTKINKRIYDNNILKIFTFICLIFGILGAVLILINDITKGFFIVSLILGILTMLFSILCIIWTLQLKKEEENIKKKQMERLV